VADKNIIIFCEDHYEELELWYPYYRLQEEGFNVSLIGTEKLDFQGKYGYPVKADMLISEVDYERVDGLVIPGGYAPDRLRRYDKVLELVKKIYEKGKPVASICHGPWVMISAGILKGKKSTCYYAIRDDVKNAGSFYEDKPVVVDGNIITSRTPADLPVFMEAIIAALKG